jgi:cyclopropane fatty-acyl-phospholipid synthase-like methyltransferase
MSHVAAVRAYYERNTRLFRMLGTDRQLHTVHRAIWAAGVQSKAEALHYINNQIVAAIQACEATNLRVLDLGCGVGATLCYLAQALPSMVQGVGVTISPAQLRLAQRFAAQQRLTERCSFMLADFSDLPCATKFDYAIAIESLIHAPDPARVLAQAAHTLKPGGRLVVCDDTIAPKQHSTRASIKYERIIAAFRRGWYAPGIRSVTELVATARVAGLELVEQRDLTPDLRLLSLPEQVERMLLRLCQQVPSSWFFSQSLIGGLALQIGLRRGIFQYRWLVFEKHG